MAMMSWMSSLPARFASTGILNHRLGGIERIGRRGDRGIGRVSVEPFSQIADQCFELCDPLLKLDAPGTNWRGRQRSIAHAR